MKYSFTLIAFLLSGIISYSQSNYVTAFERDDEGSVSVTVNAGDKLFFSAPDNMHGRELWVTDGTSAGTHIVKDINPGIAGSVNINFAFSAYAFNGILYFKANDGVTGHELWRSDGTESGTWLVKDLYIDNGDHSLSDFASTDSVLYFIGNGTTLWRSNGTAAGTYPLRSFLIARNLAAFKNNIYFSAAADNNGEELWKSNGATGATSLLRDLNGVIGASLPCNFHATSNALYFTAVTNAGWELWKTTGTYDATKMVKDINPGGANSVLDFYTEATIINIGNTVYFRATDGTSGYQLWKSDGSEAGTVRVSNIADGVSQYCNFPIVNGKIFFNSYSGPDYWQYDPVAGIVSPTGYPFYNYFENNYSRNARFIGSHLYYAGTDSIYGSEMWLSDGSPFTTRRIQETHLIDNFYTIYSSGFNSILGTIGSRLLFTLARRPYDTKVPLFMYDTSLNSFNSFRTICSCSGSAFNY
jgi:ELWxxDGT repeat protein